MMTSTALKFYLLAGALCMHYSDSLAVPVQPCPIITCKCPFGTTWVTDINGCVSCSCLPKPVDCPQLNCSDKVCPYGFETAENNCPTCRCKLRPTCPDIGLAAGGCPYGTTVDDNACTVCRNNTLPCPVRRCAISCPFGFRKDSHGCSTCECKPRICPQFGCPSPETCPSEVFRDSNGCSKCRCKCPVPICPTIKCANGLATDSLGCQICQCKPFVCPGFQCRIACPGDFQTDEHGCPICQCKFN